MSDNSLRLLSDITVFSKYARYLPDIKRREDWGELVKRNCDMHVKRYPQLADMIRGVFKKYVLPKKVLPSMRALQFGGRPIEVANNRIFNCAYMPVDHPCAFNEMMFLLLGGTGGGYSVQCQHVSKLPRVVGPKNKVYDFVVGDSIEGWADAVKALVRAHFYGEEHPVFHYDEIREKGAPLVTSGGKAPGPEPLRVCLEKLEEVLLGARGRKLTSLEAHDMMCIVADAVLAGGIRRAALICLFSRDDEEMLTCKAGEWWKDAPWRGRANNSAVLPRGKVSREEFDAIWQAVEASGSGEPGVYWTSDEDWGTNPCCEIGLRPFQFCNVTEVNASDVREQWDLDKRVEAAAFIGTLQAGYTDFKYLRSEWKETTEEDALVGVGLTGIASGAVLGLDLAEAARVAVGANQAAAELIGINAAARVTTVKPAGTTSLVVGSSSGIHAWHAEHYIRRIRVGKNEALYQYMLENAPALVEDDAFNPQGAVLSFPQKAPDGAIMRTESAADLLERVKRFNLEWVREGHVYGANSHNVSCTVSIKADEWGPTGDWMWENRHDYNGIAALPFDGGTYPQAPFTECTADEYAAMLPLLEGLDMHDVVEHDDRTDLKGEAACAGGLCEIA